MAEINPKSELLLRLTIEERTITIRGQVDGARRKRGIAGLMEIVPGMYRELLQSLERLQDNEAEKVAEKKRAG
jgi:hypothetical protein